MLEVNSNERFDFTKIKHSKWINQPCASKEDVRKHCSKDRKWFFVQINFNEFVNLLIFF